MKKFNQKIKTHFLACVFGILGLKKTGFNLTIVHFIYMRKVVYDMMWE